MAYSNNPNLPKARATAIRLLSQERLLLFIVANRCGVFYGSFLLYINGYLCPLFCHSEMSGRWREDVETCNKKLLIGSWVR